MSVLAAVSALASLGFLAVCGTLAVRLLLLARRTRALPERVLGCGLALMVWLGCPLAILGSVPNLLPGVTAAGASVASMLFVGAGVVCVYAFTWIVFRPRAAWARRAVLAVAAVSLFQVLGNAHAGLGAPDPALYLERTRDWTMLHHLLISGAFAWTGVEALLYHRILVRRLALGLTDAVVADRFQLFAGMGAAATLMNVVNTASLAAGWSILAHPVPQLATALFGSLAATCMYLALLPPARYLRRVERRGGRARPTPA